MAVKYSLADYVRNTATQERRQRFVKRATEFVLDHKFNGIDLMWDFSDLRYTLLQFCTTKKFDHNSDVFIEFRSFSVKFKVSTETI